MNKMFQLEVTGVESLIYQCERRKELYNQVAVTVLEYATEAVAQERAFVSVRTGNLQSKIRVISFNPNLPNISVVFGVTREDVPYCDYVEYGTIKMHARPYHRPVAFERFWALLNKLREMANMPLLTRDENAAAV